MGKSLLMYAHDIRIVRLLIERGLDVNARDHVCGIIYAMMKFRIQTLLYIGLLKMTGMLPY